MYNLDARIFGSLLIKQRPTNVQKSLFYDPATSDECLYSSEEKKMAFSFDENVAPLLSLRQATYSLSILSGVARTKRLGTRRRRRRRRVMPRA